MTEKKGQIMGKDGGSKSAPLTGGYVRKGGHNNPVSQIQTRPAAPAPMRPLAPQSADTDEPVQSGGAKLGR